MKVKLIAHLLIFIMVGLCFSACAWPKVYCRSSSGSVIYDRMSHRLEIVWESTTQTPDGAPVTHESDSTKVSE